MLPSNKRIEDCDEYPDSTECAECGCDLREEGHASDCEEKCVWPGCTDSKELEWRHCEFHEYKWQHR